MAKYSPESMRLLATTPDHGPLELPDPQFNPSLARLLVQACKAIYTAHPDIQGKRTDTNVLLHEDDKSVIVAFRGSKSIENWLTDFDVMFSPFWVGEVHQGFNQAIHDVIDEIDRRLARLVISKRRLFITGHSLGGALAILGASILEHRGYEIDSVYTFGQPRVGNAHFCAAYDRQLGSRTFRVINQSDIVPRVPGILWGYRNLAQKIFLTPFREKLEINPSFWIMAIADSLDICRDAITRRKLALLADHHIGQYIAHLDEI